MGLGRSVPEWAALQDRLRELAAQTGAHNAYVVDNWGNLWCEGLGATWKGQAAIITTVLNAVEALDLPLNRGGKLDRSTREPERTYLRSFASIYVVALRFSDAFDLARIRAAVGEALPQIQALTIRLPPPDGPGTDGAEGHGVA